MSSMPFVVGQWVRAERFYGRRDLVDEILHGNRDWLWLLGTRRIGKTSLLKQVEYLTSTADSPYLPVFWDFQGADDPQELQGLLLDAVEDAEPRLAALGLDTGAVEGADLFASLGRLRRQVRARGKKLLLLCDEVEALVRLQQSHPTLPSKLRRVLQSEQDVRSVLTSSIRLWALADVPVDTSPFLHGFTPPLYIDRLGDGEAHALLTQDQLPAISRPPMEPRAAEKIRACCDGHPYLLQLVAKRYLEHLALDEALEEVGNDRMVRHFFSVDFEMLSELERDVIRLIASTSAADSNSIQGRLGAESRELGDALQRLVQLGYLRRDEGRRFKIVNRFFRQWLGEQEPPDAATVVRSIEGRTGPSATRFDGRYELLDTVGEGVFGVVYKAHDRLLDETVALKLLRRVYAEDPTVLERFRQEILLSRDLVHPAIVRVHHLGDWRGQKYLTMKWIDGSTLAQLLAGARALDLDRCRALSVQLASALECAHAGKVLHRDIKPQNILVDDAGRPYLTDFGLARLIDAPSLTDSGVFVGTPQYASPEQADHRPLDGRSDLYSLGVVMFEMSTGRRPFVADSLAAVLELQRSAAPPHPQHLRPEIPGDFAAVILRCLHKKPGQRFSSAAELRRAVEALESP